MPANRLRSHHSSSSLTQCLILRPFQSNFYLDDDSGREDLGPQLCDLCDGKRDAQFTCSKCHNDLCSECRRSHDKLCHSKTFTVLQHATGACTQGGRILHPQSNAGAQAEALDVALKPLADRSRQAERERKSLERDIHVRYATLLRLAAEARDASLVSLRDAAQAAKDRLQAEENLLLASQAEDTGAGSPSVQPLPSPFSDEDLLKIRGRTTGRDGSPVFRWLGTGHGDAASVEKSLRSFMGTVVEAGQASDQTPDSDGVHADAAQNQRPPLQGEAGMLEIEPPHVLTGNTGSSGDRRTAFDSLMDRISSTNVFVSALQKELTSLRDKSCILCQDIDVMKAENSKLRKDITDNGANVTALREDHSSLKTVVTSAKREAATLQRAMKDSDTKAGVPKAKMGEKDTCAKGRVNVSPLSLPHRTRPPLLSRPLPFPAPHASKPRTQ